MQKSKKLQNQNSIKATLEDREKSSNQTAIFNQQNNFHLTQNIDIDKLNQLSNKNPELAKSIIGLYEKQLEHNINIDNKILTIEEKEQALRAQELPFQRKYAFRALNFAVILSIVSLASAGFFAYFGHVKLAATAIVIPITITVANILNRNNNQKK